MDEFPVALNQKLNQCHHKDREAFLRHLGLLALRGSRRQNTLMPSVSEDILRGYWFLCKSEVLDAFTWLLNRAPAENGSALVPSNFPL